MAVLRKKSLAMLWKDALRMGAATARRDPILGLKRLVLPLSYWRSVEFQYVWENLAVKPGARVLDLGSPKDLALLLAREENLEVEATDILQSAIDVCEAFKRAQLLADRGPGSVRCAIQDGRNLTYADNTFDAAFSVSVLEHIPDSGDTVAIGELLRVVKAGGRVIVTTPFDRAYRETFVGHDVYERRAAGEKVFFERHYDSDSLRKRLLDVSGAKVVDVQYWSERLPVETLLVRIGPLRVPLSPLEPLLAASTLFPSPAADRARAVFFTLEKVA